MKVAQYFGHNFQRVSLLRHPMVLGTQCVGVEVELENIEDWDMRSDYWVIKEDGSLRNNGREFVFRGPTGGKDLYNALVELDTFLAERNPDGNWRCSTHVHLDVRDMNLKQLKLMILAYLVAEKALFRLAAMHRYTNNFCAAIGFAQEQLQILANAWTAPDIGSFWRKIDGWNKYSALNLIPMHNFGSVEFRMSDAKWKKNDLLLLCNRFLALKELAMHWGGTEEELVAFMMNSPIHEVFPKGIPVDMAADFLNEDMSTGHKLAFDLLTFQAVAANVEREPVVMPEIRGGDGQWNNLQAGEHMEIIDFMVRAGVDHGVITNMLYDIEPGQEVPGELAPAVKIRSHVICRHFWSLWLHSLGQRIPNNIDLPSLIPSGVVRYLVRHNWAQVTGLFNIELVNHLRDPDQVEPQAGFGDPLQGGIQVARPGQPIQPVRRGNRRVNAAPQINWGEAAQHFGEAAVGRMVVAEDDVAVDDEFPAVGEEPF